MSDKPPEQATEKVWLLASPELLAEILEQGWTRPVQIKVTPPAVLGQPWEMEAREVREKHDDQTLYKVRVALNTTLITETEVTDAIIAMQSAGVLFRERT